MVRQERCRKRLCWWFWVWDDVLPVLSMTEQHLCLLKINHGWFVAIIVNQNGLVSCAQLDAEIPNESCNCLWRAMPRSWGFGLVEPLGGNRDSLTMRITLVNSIASQSAKQATNASAADEAQRNGWREPLNACCTAFFEGERSTVNGRMVSPSLPLPLPWESRAVLFLLIF